MSGITYCECIHPNARRPWAWLRMIPCGIHGQQRDVVLTVQTALLSPLSFTATLANNHGCLCMQKRADSAPPPPSILHFPASATVQKHSRGRCSVRGKVVPGWQVGGNWQNQTGEKILKMIPIKKWLVPPAGLEDMHMAVKTKPQSTQACNSAKVVSSLHNPDLMSHNLTMYLSRFLSSFLPRVIASVASGSFVRDIGLRYFCKAAQTMFFVKSAIEIKLSDRWKKIKKTEDIVHDRHHSPVYSSTNTIFNPSRRITLFSCTRHQTQSSDSAIWAPRNLLSRLMSCPKLTAEDKIRAPVSHLQHIQCHSLRSSMYVSGNFNELK